jgi:hypothetical protein
MDLSTKLIWGIALMNLFAAGLCALFSRELLKLGINVYDEGYPTRQQAKDRDLARCRQQSRFVTYHRSGAISVNLRDFLRSPQGQAQLKQAGELRKYVNR